MANHRWNYCGDVNLEHGGYFWREAGAADYVEAVDVVPCGDAGGPGNMFWITVGSIYLGNNRVSALDCIGAAPDTADRATVVDAHCAYYGVESDCYGLSVVRIGPAEPCGGGGAGRYAGPGGSAARERVAVAVRAQDPFGPVTLAYPLRQARSSWAHWLT